MSQKVEKAVYCIFGFFINNSPSVYFENRTQNIRCNFCAKDKRQWHIHEAHACTVRMTLTHVLHQLHPKETEKYFAPTLRERPLKTFC